MARQNDVKTLAAITGQPTEDVVAMLKQYNGDVNAATNALMDSACPSNRAFSGVIGTGGKPNGGRGTTRLSRVMARAGRS
jgi:hypothetical protein